MGVCYYHKEKLSDLELLLELQHYGAATGLVDFSRDFLIALWFAAHDNKGKNGKVFVLNINDIDKFSSSIENLSLSSCKIGFFSSCKILIVFVSSIV
jgi:hypothetical protein